jgi:hypothetical protein
LYCKNCGTANADDAVYCQKCGADLRAASAPTGSGMPGSTVPPSYLGANPMPSSMNVMGVIRHAIDLTKNPAGVMSAYRDTDPSFNSLLINYVAVLAAIPFVATLIGDLIIYSYTSADVGIAFGQAIFGFISNLIAVFVVGFVVWKLAPRFGTSTTQIRATRLAAYSFTPFFLVSVINIIPYSPIRALDTLALLYGIYIIYLGLPIMLGTPQSQVITYLVVTFVVVIVVYVVLAVVIGAILLAIFGLALGLAFL